MAGRRALVAASGLLLVAVGATGCGGSAATDHGHPSAGVTTCRAQWRSLGHDIAEDAAGTLPSDLPDRWNTVAATVDYYRTSAGAKDCGQDLDEQRQAISALKEFSARLAPYDMQARLAGVRSGATAYAAGPWPPAPSPSPTTKGGKKRKPRPLPRPPKPALVRAALAALSQQAPLATRQQQAGWDQAGVTELTADAAVAKAVKDLRFLSAESPAYRQCSAALALIGRALAAKR